MTDVLSPSHARRAAEPAPLTNMRLGLATMLDCQEAEEGSPRLGLLYGPSGYGKSVAAATVASRLDAAYVVAKSVWSQRMLLEAIAAEIGLLELPRTVSRLLEQIIEALQFDPKPLIIDEMDHLVKRQAVEIIRDIHDAARIPILMIGEESLPAKLKSWERFDNRILVATPAQPATVADGLMLRDHYCPRVQIGDDIVEAIVTATKGVTRRIVTNLQIVQSVAISEGRAVMDLSSWGDRRFKTGTVLVRKSA